MAREVQTAVTNLQREKIVNKEIKFVNRHNQEPVEVLRWTGDAAEMSRVLGFVVYSDRSSKGMLLNRRVVAQIDQWVIKEKGPGKYKVLDHEAFWLDHHVAA